MPQTQEVKELAVQEFQLFKNREALISFERENRMRIVSAPLSTFEKFIHKYQNVVGEALPYAGPVNQPAPIQRSLDEHKRINPKDNNYGVIIETKVKEVPIRRRIDGVVKTIFEQREVGIGRIADNGYWEVSFQPKGSPEDPTNVTLSLNGQCLHMQRGVPVILPGPFLEVADNGAYPVYVQLPNQPRKVTGYRMHFPYIVLRRCTRNEYESMLADGNAKTAEARKIDEQGQK